MNKVLLAAMVLMAGLLCACTSDTNTNTNTNANAIVTASPLATTTPARGVPPRTDDHDFATDAAQGGMEEVELGRLAAQKATNPDVKKFGQRMVADHSKAGAELKQLATTKKMELPAAMTSDQKADIDKLSKLSGAEFDREYMSMMVADHDKDVAAFEDESQNGADADLKAWASKTLPTLKEHQKMAHDINSKLK